MGNPVIHPVKLQLRSTASRTAVVPTCCDSSGLGGALQSCRLAQWQHLTVCIATSCFLHFLKIIISLLSFSPLFLFLIVQTTFAFPPSISLSPPAWIINIQLLIYGFSLSSLLSHSDCNATPLSMCVTTNCKHFASELYPPTHISTQLTNGLITPAVTLSALRMWVTKCYINAWEMHDSQIKTILFSPTASFCTAPQLMKVAI